MKLDKFLLITVGALFLVVLLLLVFGGAGFLCLFATQIPASNQGSMLQKAYDYNGTLAGSDIVNVEAVNANGFINVVEGDGDNYAVHVDARGTEKDLARYDIQFTRTDVNGVPTLKVEIKDLKEPKTLNTKYSSDMTLTLPKGKAYNLTAVTANGHVDVGKLNCTDISLVTANGAVTSKAIAGNATYVTVNGDIDVKSDARKGDVYLNTVNGAITVSIPKDAPVSLSAHLVNGAISNDLPIVISEKSRLGLVGKTANYTEGVYIETAVVNGDITIKGH